MKFSSCDVTSGNVLGRYVLSEKKGWDRGRWLGSAKEQKSMEVSRLRCRRPWLALGEPFLSSFVQMG